MHEFDITYGDFNPKILYAYKRKTEEEGTYHCHEFPEFTYIIEGGCKYLVEGEEYELHTGDLLVANPGVYHKYIALEGVAPPTEFYCGFRNFHFRNMPQDSIIIKDNAHIMHCKDNLQKELSRICHSMHEEHMSNNAGKYFMVQAYFVQMLLLVARANIEEPTSQSGGYIFKSNSRGYIVHKIIDYLNENYDQKISLDQIAHNMYLSPVYISKLFKEVTGESPINYLIQIRLTKAKHILEQRNVGSIKEVAKQVGYEDVYYFSKLFKKYFGMAPLFYKKNMEKSDTKKTNV